MTALSRRLLAATLLLLAGSAGAAPVSEAAAALRAQYASLGGQLRDNPFGRPLVLSSSEAQSGLAGDIYAVVAYPLQTVSTALRPAANWCEVMILHINTKYCRAVTAPTGTRLQVHIGKKTPQDLADASAVEFTYRETAVTPVYFAITLSAKDGPMGTSNYQIRLEAVALPNKQSFLHLTYAYDVGLAGRVAMQGYLATVGAGKVGFTLVDQGQAVPPDYVGGVRGVVERNTMRYYLAIDSFLASQAELPAAQREARLQAWFTAVERYPRQLHEVDRAAYLTMKRAEVARQQSVY